MTRRISVARLVMAAISICSVLALGCGGTTTTSRATTIASRANYSRSLHVPLVRTLDDDRSECTPHTVFFSYDSDRLDGDSRGELERAARCMRRGMAQTLHLVGSTDPRGTEEYNLALGERRARAVRDFLLGLGVDERQITFSSVGEELAHGEDEATWALDRHVETVGVVLRDINGEFAVRDDMELGAMLDAPAF
jgi:outer membrane protein OmpA-like peptidoglycan-associated protein